MVTHPKSPGQWSQACNSGNIIKTTNTSIVRLAGPEWATVFTVLVSPDILQRPLEAFGQPRFIEPTSPNIDVTKDLSLKISVLAKDFPFFGTFSPQISIGLQTQTHTHTHTHRCFRMYRKERIKPRNLQIQNTAHLRLSHSPIFEETFNNQPPLTVTVAAAAAVPVPNHKVTVNIQILLPPNYPQQNNHLPLTVVRTKSAAAAAAAAAVCHSRAPQVSQNASDSHGKACSAWSAPLVRAQDPYDLPCVFPVRTAENK
ncbi:hypothetical protein PoB_001256800 [Plakobranchus ocellatus]|uniref:Uncharacterized protein n=1 Tax=Plakobranchus ocellatus TaxID=259542 RepID=A0AAV3YV07_9GAST|nr:hypothetical protein PoB_001256800 [Plakobranchus ocellatus]